MSWTPITLEEMASLVAMEVGRLDANDVEKWRRFATPLEHVPCVRGASNTVEAVYIVARLGDNVVIYDDVEGEFSIGNLVTDGVLRRWTLVGELRWALDHLLN